jgi:hypothetical protein
MIRGSIINSQRIKGGIGVGGSGVSMRFKLNRINPSVALQSIPQVSSITSFPNGYRLPKAILFPLENGEIAGYSYSAFDTSCSIIGFGYIESSITVTFTVSCSAQLLADMFGSTTVTFSTLCEVIGYGYIQGTANISALPSAADIAGEVFATKLEGEYSMRDIMKLMSAVSFGKSTIVDLGGGIATVTFRDINDTVDRVEADMTSSERTNVTKNLS